VKNQLSRIRRLVGEGNKEQLGYVDCFVADEFALFMPVRGACFYALTPEHAYTTHMFIFHFCDQIIVRLYGNKVAGKPGKVFALWSAMPYWNCLPTRRPDTSVCSSAGFLSKNTTASVPERSPRYFTERFSNRLRDFPTSSNGS
jgi:hypothetical protein